MHINVQEAIRRLIIIILEDALPIPALSFLAWLMMATSKGYFLTPEQTSFTLGVVYLISHSNYRLPVKSVDSQIDFDVITQLEHIERDVIWAMLFRKAYGGMKGDQDMLDRLSVFWSNIFMVADGVIWDVWCVLRNQEVELIDLDVLPEPSKLDLSKVLITASVDQHSHVQIIRLIRLKHPNLTEDDIRGALWLHRSRLNKRPIADPKIAKEGQPPEKFLGIWNLIKDDAEMLSRKVIMMF
jgi:hypothetical protein